MAIKKLIEVALPLEKINAESAREKSIRHGHPSTLHLWWARRPLAAARAVIWSSLVDDPSSHPEQFPTEEAQTAERQRLFRILEDLVVWENSNNDEVLAAAKAEIMRSTDNNPPALLDPFAGGGAIPLEAQRLGLEAHAHDLNPVAVMINKAMIEIPPKFTGQAPVNPTSRANAGFVPTEWTGAKGLAEDVRYYGEWMKQEAFKRIGHLYPKVEVPKEQGGGEATVIAWIWARTVKCPNPACGCEMPLVRSFTLSRKKGQEAWIRPEYEEKNLVFTVEHIGKPNEGGTITRSGAHCARCGDAVSFQYIRKEGQNNRIGSRLMAIVADGKSGRIFITPSIEHAQAARVAIPNDAPITFLPDKALSFRVQVYGMVQHRQLFTNRQILALSTYSNLVAEAIVKANYDAVEAGLLEDYQGLSAGGRCATAYAQAIGVYLAFGVSRLTDICNSLCRWEISKTQVRNLFGRQAIPMVWDYAENNIFAGAAGDYTTSLGSIVRVIQNFRAVNEGNAKQFDAQSDNGMRGIIVSTDPPYYDNIGYADLSDFFYCWLRPMLKDIYPKLFRTMLVPKTEELVATPYRFDGSVSAARDFFENGMLKTCQQIYLYSREDLPITIYYAYKQSDSDDERDVASEQIVSTGWETMLTAIVIAGFAITGTWPIRTELSNRPVGSGTNALASSIVLVCRKRPADAPTATRRNFINELKRELKPALQKLQRSNIAPVDLAQSAIGPGMGVYSRFAKVLEADGTPMTVRSALQIINQELDVFFNEQDGELDRDSRFCVDLYTQNAFNDIKFGDADTLARAKNTSVAALASSGVLYAQKGVVRLHGRDEIPMKVDSHEQLIWLLTQQLTHAMETGGIQACAEIIAPMFGSNAENAKSLAYRLFTIADRKGWAQEAYAYNALVIAWPEIQSRAAELQAVKPEQLTLFEV